MMSRGIFDSISFRPATKDDCRTIAELFSIASDGVADYVWTQYAMPGEDPLDAGARRYSADDSPFSYRNCIIARSEDRVAGMMAAFPMIKPPGPAENPETDPVLVPYSRLEQYDSYYIAGMALYPEFRGGGAGSRFLGIAEETALEKNLPQLSLIVFEENAGALRLYRRNGFYETGREPVVPHRLIRHTGYALLMVKDVRRTAGTSWPL